MGERGREDRDHRLGVGYLFQDFGLDLGGIRRVGMLDDGHLLTGKLRHAQLEILLELGNPALTPRQRPVGRPGSRR